MKNQDETNKKVYPTSINELVKKIESKLNQEANEEVFNTHYNVIKSSIPAEPIPEDMGAGAPIPTVPATEKQEKKSVFINIAKTDVSSAFASPYFADDIYSSASEDNSGDEIVNDIINKHSMRKKQQQKTEKLKTSLTKVICGVSGKEIPNPKYVYCFSQVNGQMAHVHEDHVKQLNTCLNCSGLFSESLENEYCLSCIQGAQKSYIRGYHHKAESSYKKIISKVDKVSFQDKNFAAKVFGQDNPSSYAVHSGGCSPILFGVELEFEVKGKESDIANQGYSKEYGVAILQVHSLLSKESQTDGGLKAIMKRDGTLKMGFEVVSAPADKLHHYKTWDKFFGVINANPNIYIAPFFKAPGAERGTGCGLHIHISKDAMINQMTNNYGLSCLKLQTFIYSEENRKFIELIAGRASNEFSNFTQKRGINVHKSGRINVNTSVALLNSGAVDHRTAVNFNSSNGRTIEFRIFRSTMDVYELLRNIDFVDAVCTFCRTGNASIQQCKNALYFFEFVCKNRQDYPYLFKFLNRSEEFMNIIKKLEQE